MGPVNRVPRNVDGMPVLYIKEVRVASWGLTLPKDGPPTEVHLLIQLGDLPGPLILRVNQPEALDELIESLRFHRAEVWPTPAPPR